MTNHINFDKITGFVPKKFYKADIEQPEHMLYILRAHLEPNENLNATSASLRKNALWEIRQNLPRTGKIYCL